MSQLFFVFVLMLAAPNEEGAEFVVRSVCRIDAGKSGLQVTDAASGTPLADFPLQARCLHAKVALRTGKDGGVQKPEGVCVLMHEGSEFHDPCFLWTHAARSRSGKAVPRLFWVLLLLVVAGALALFPMRRFRRPRQGKSPVMPDESAPEPMEIEISPEKRTFVPWRKPFVQGQVQVWESSLPLSGVKITFLARGAQGETATGENGAFSVPADALNLVFEKEGFHSVAVARPAGKLTVRMMSLPVRALWLLRQICQRHDPTRAARLSPRDALLARIPPPEVISRLELLAYGGVSPEPSELEQLEKELQL